MFRRVLSTAAAQVDRAMTAVITARSRSNVAARAETLGHAQRMHWLERTRELYERPEHFDTPERFFVRKGNVEFDYVAVRSYGAGGRVVDLRWASRFESMCSDVAETYGACRENRVAAA